MFREWITRRRLQRTFNRAVRRSDELRDAIAAEERRALEAHAEADESTNGYNNARALHAFSVFTERRQQVVKLTQERAAAELSVQQARAQLLEFGNNGPAPTDAPSGNDTAAPAADGDGSESAENAATESDAAGADDTIRILRVEPSDDDDADADDAEGEESKPDADRHP